MGVLNYVLLISAILGAAYALPPHASTIRPPAFPLAVRAPYSSVWLAHDTLPGYWPSFWTGQGRGWTGFVRVDGVTYNYMGGTPLGIRANQTSTAITPTQTYFNLAAGPVDLNVTFFSPVEYDDVERQSIPLSYVFVSVIPRDSRTHNVQLYMDITGEWAAADDKQNITWSLSETASKLKVFSTELQNPIKFGEHNDQPKWGQAIFATSANAEYESGSDVDVRNGFINFGKLNNTEDKDFRCASCEWPTFAFVHDLGDISSESTPVQYVVGHVREENINLMNVPQKALWTYYFDSQAEMIDFFYHDVAGAAARANELDIKLLTEAFEAEGQSYADIIALTTRQSYGATEFSGNRTNPVLYLKEISSNGNMQTVDVMYPATPMFYHLNVNYLKYLLEPLFQQMEGGFWPSEFSIHDIGSHFPNATGHPDGVEEDMPVEESANMIIMVGNIIFHPSKSLEEASAYARAHFTILSQWADFLNRNCLYPVNQLTTDDFIGHTELNSGLALKGIIGMKTFAKIADLLGEKATADFYNDAVSRFVQTWVDESFTLDDEFRPHLKMEYNKTDGYQFKYNAFQDKLLSLNVVPEGIYSMEADYYLTKEEEYGTPFVSTHDYTKSDWEMWTAAAFGEASPKLRTNLVQQLGRYIRETPTRVPFSDWYTTATGRNVGFLARPVVGGHFSLLALNNPAAP